MYIYLHMDRDPCGDSRDRARINCFVVYRAGREVGREVFMYSDVLR